MNLQAQVAAANFTVHVPSLSEKDKGVFITGSFNYWHTGDTLYRMEKKSEGIYSIVIPVFENKAYEYKYTLGHWDRVEVALNDSNITNRHFISVNNCIITDTVLKWKEPGKETDKNQNPQMQQLNAMKDSALAKLQPELNKLKELFIPFIENLLSEKPSKKIFRQLNKKATDKVDTLYMGVAALFWDVFAMLTPEQKVAIKNLLNKPGADKDYLNSVLNSLNTVIENK